MSNAAIRKARERHLLERFLSVAQIEAEIIAASESPDFEISLEGRAIGVEITELYKQQPSNQRPLQAQDSLSFRIVESSRRQYDLLGGIPVWVSLTFFGAFDLRTAHRDTLAKSIAEHVWQMLLPQGQYMTWKNDYTNDALSSVAFMSVCAVTSPDFAHWSASASGWDTPLTRELLQPCVTEKNEKVKAYRSRYNEVWLVVATQGSTPSQFFDLSALSHPERIISSFDRAYFFASFPSQVVCLGKRRDA